MPTPPTRFRTIIILGVRFRRSRSLPTIPRRGPTRHHPSWSSPCNFIMAVLCYPLPPHQYRRPAQRHMSTPRNAWFFSATSLGSVFRSHLPGRFASVPQPVVQRLGVCFWCTLRLHPRARWQCARVLGAQLLLIFVMVWRRVDDQREPVHALPHATGLTNRLTGQWKCHCGMWAVQWIRLAEISSRLFF